MLNKKHLIKILLIFTLICLTIGVLQTASAAKYTLVDEGSAKYKDSNTTKLTWKVYSSDKQLKINTKKVNGNNTISTKKVVIKKSKYNKLKISTASSYKGNITKKSFSVKSKLSHDSYYSKVYKPKMVKNLVKNKLFEKATEPFNNGPHGEITWKAYISYGKKVFISDKTHNLHGYANRTTLIERYGINKLKITTKTIDNYYQNLPDAMPSKNTKITYVKTKLSPKEYYLKTYKGKLFKQIPKEYEIEIAYSVLKNSTTNFYWVALKERNTNLVWNKVSIYRGFSFTTYNSFINNFYDKITIETVNNNNLKITYQINKTKEIKYVNTNLLPVDYYLKVYREEMMEICDKSIIGKITLNT